MTSQEEYQQEHPDGVNPVQINDVCFTLHAVLITGVTIVQCFLYEVWPAKLFWLSTFLKRLEISKSWVANKKKVWYRQFTKSVYKKYIFSRKVSKMLFRFICGNNFEHLFFLHFGKVYYFLTDRSVYKVSFFILYQAL